MKVSYFSKPFMSLAAVSLALSGCMQTGPGGAGISASQTSADDSCRQERLALDASQQYFAADMIKAMMAGAATGAATGLVAGLLSGDTKNVGQTVAVTAVAGATAAMAGYWAALQKSNLSGAALYSKLSSDASTEGRALDEAISKRDALYACRDREIAAVRAGYASRRIDLATGQAQIKRIYQAQLQDASILEAIGTKAKERNESFLYATTQATGSSPQRIQAAQPSGSKPAAADTAQGVEVQVASNARKASDFNNVKKPGGEPSLT